MRNHEKAPSYIQNHRADRAEPSDHRGCLQRSGGAEHGRTGETIHGTDMIRSGVVERESILGIL